MAVEKSFALSPALQSKVDMAVAKGNEKFAGIAHIICESVIDAGAFFESEAEDREKTR